MIRRAEYSYLLLCCSVSLMANIEEKIVNNIKTKVMMMVKDEYTKLEYIVNELWMSLQNPVGNSSSRCSAIFQ